MKAFYSPAILAVGLAALLVGVGMASNYVLSVVDAPVVTYPKPGDRITLPLRISGVAPHCWFAQSKAPVELFLPRELRTLVYDDAHITETFQGEWGKDEATPFTATIDAPLPSPGTEGIVILRQAGVECDTRMPGIVEVPVRF